MFYEFSQNNSGGFFINDNKLCWKLFIEADNINDAISKAEELGCYWDGVSNGIDCPCCGDRWHEPYDEDGLVLPKEITVTVYSSIKNWNDTYGKYKVIKKPIKKKFCFGNTEFYEGKIKVDTIEEYAQYLADEYGMWTTPDVRIFYKDGNVKDIFREE